MTECKTGIHSRGIQNDSILLNALDRYFSEYNSRPHVKTVNPMTVYRTYRYVFQVQCFWTVVVDWRYNFGATVYAYLGKLMSNENPVFL